MDDELAKGAPKIQADNHSIAIGEINISGTVTGNITIGHTIMQPADARLRHELGILLKNVQTTWIKGVLEKSVHEAALLELGLELREEAVDNPWRMVIETPDQTRETLPRGRRIKDIFDEANRLLLILGEPGSGKTTTLLQLARDLITEVDDAFTQPVPVILNLSTWTNKAQPLDEWLVAELNSKYRLPKNDGQRWLKERRILPLLDGLDEVRAENRAACVEKINQLVVDYGLQGIVVCSRIKDYTALNVRLAFYRAIYIQPLTPEQVDEYLNEAGDKLASLRATLQADESLRSMAQSPLILNIMSLAYQNTSAESLSDPALNTDKARRKHLFDTYIARMFNRKSPERTYNNENTKNYLSWLARNMHKHNQEIFLIEGLQPSWLSVRAWEWVYFLASRTSSVLAIFLNFTLAYTLVNGLDSTRIEDQLRATLSWAPFGIPVGFIDALRFEWLSKHVERRKTSNLLRGIINVVIVCLIVWLFGRLILGFGNWLGSFFIIGLIFGSRGILQTSETDIHTVEALRWSWRKASTGGLIFGIVGLIIGIYQRVSDFGMSIAVRLDLSNLIDLLPVGLYVLSFALVYGLIIGAIGLMFSGFLGEIIETKSSPNQGIRLSIRNAILIGLIMTPGFALIYLIGTELLNKLFAGLSYESSSLDYLSGLYLGLLLGLTGALWYGGFDVIQHYTLRLILLIQGHTPANYVRFLDYAVDRIFLQKVGGGYRFIHRLLLEHFAEMGEMKKV